MNDKFVMNHCFFYSVWKIRIEGNS